MSAETPSVFDAAAESLSNAERGGARNSDSKGQELLIELGYLDDSSGFVGSSANVAERVRMLRAAGRMKRLFLIPIRSAPGLVFMGGEADPATLGSRFRGQPVGSLSGSGLTLRDAFESCVGEGVEYLSQFEHTHDVRPAGSGLPRLAAFPPDASIHCPDDDGDWLLARRLRDDTPVLLPADRCLRRVPPRSGGPPPFALSTGCAAGASLEAATLHGLLELIERDCTSLWWRGGRFGRPLALEEGALGDAVQMLAALRGTTEGRQSWLLDITSDLGVPCVAALSVEPSGKGLACGLAARLTLPAAVRAALMEMCHIELAYNVIAAKRAERGEQALNETDRRHLERASRLDANDCALLHPRGAPVSLSRRATEPVEARLTRLIECLTRKGIDLLAIDLTRPELKIPVIRVVAPSLQLEPCKIVTPRLATAIAETGGGDGYTVGVPML